MRIIYKIILHCSDSPNPAQTIDDIRRWHMDPKFPGGPLKDVGYHYFIRMDGCLQFGRKEEEIGAHCKGENSHSIGVCLAGRNNFREIQFHTLIDLLFVLHEKYPVATIHGHCEFNPLKTCPNFDYSEALEYWESL